MVPLYPNEEIPYVRGSCIASGCVPMTKLEAGGGSRSSTSVLRRFSCALAGTDALAIILCTLSSPICPDGASVWPMLAFAAPIASGRALSPRKTAASAPASVGSPSAVPVPCASTQPTWADGTDAKLSAASSSARCAEPFGAVRLAERPSCRTALPLRETADWATPTQTAPAPSARTYPFARASSVLHLPSSESMPAAAAESVGVGTSLSEHANASARPLSPPRTASAAACSAAIADEHAVSIEAHGPCEPRTKASRPAATDRLSPVTA
eukprot:3721343-Pleurochrysis_carterae.AAC.1